jgi:hypothetical protein
MKKIGLNFLLSTLELACKALFELVTFVAKRIQDLELWATAHKAKL